MRSRRVSQFVCLPITVLLLLVGSARAQVDWSDLFPEEGKKAPAPRPRAVEPPPAPAKPVLREEEPPPRRVARPKPVRANGRQTAKAKPSRKIVPAPSEEAPEFPEAAEVAPPHFDRHSKQDHGAPSSADSAHRTVSTTSEEPTSESIAATNGHAPKKQPAAALEPQPETAAVEKRAQEPAREAPVPAAKQEAEPAPVAAVAAATYRDGDHNGTHPAVDGNGDGLGFGLHVGEVISDKNMEKYSQLLSPGLEWALRYGLRITVGAPRPVSMPRRYLEATEKYSGQVKLSPDGSRVLNWTAGRPFPQIDPNDPQIALKIMWNFNYTSFLTDDLDARNYDADTGTIGKNKGMTVERHYLIDHLRRLIYTGRLYVEPKPNLPNPEHIRYKESIHPLLEPFDLKGVGGTFYRYDDADRQDDSWLYLPQLRRVRRLSTAQRSDALFGQDTDIDSYYGYNGQISWMDWKFLGERTVMAAMHGTHTPVKWQAPENWAFDDVWEPRRVYVLEGTSKLPQYAYGKRVLFIDKEAWVIPHTDIYDRAGQLWKVWLNLYSFKKEVIPGARISRYPDEMGFTHAIVMLDTQLVHATKAALPSTNSQDEECIFFNMGDKSGTNEEFFSVAHLIESGH